MTQKELGGPAFPQHPEMAEKLGCASAMTDAGMTLRDYFAGQALANSRTFPQDWSSTCDIAEWAYGIADAMIAERNK